nr:PREDICTED: zinc finger protein 184-like [Anolis carolinensis]|eukprot:XP_008122983.1 PREDICTED: zinc finger protein 184-like [Anolis carolinensis]
MGENYKMLASFGGVGAWSENEGIPYKVWLKTGKYRDKQEEGSQELEAEEYRRMQCAADTREIQIQETVDESKEIRNSLVYENGFFREANITDQIEKAQPECHQLEESYGSSTHLTNCENPPIVNKTYKCLDCGKCLSRKGSLNRHQISHTGAKPYKCLECGKGFVDKRSFIGHEMNHRGDNPYKCPECGKGFIHKRSLFQHEMNHRGEKPYSCLKCEKSFSRKAVLKRHQDRHMEEKSHTCLECGKSFQWRVNLKTHEKTHIGERLPSRPQGSLTSPHGREAM